MLKELNKVAKMPDKTIQMILRELDCYDLVVALKDSTPALRNKIFKNMSKRAATMLKEDSEYTGPVSKEDSKKAQEKILKLADKVVKTGGSFTKKDLQQAAKIIPTLKKKKVSALSNKERVNLFTELAEKTRRYGLLAIEKDIEIIDDDFIKRGMEYVVDGTDPRLVKGLLVTKLESIIRKTELKYKMAIEGILSVQAGDNPRIVKEKLSCF